MNLEQALHILGGNFAKCQVNKNRAYSSKEYGGLSLCFRYSRKYEGNVWWTSESPLTIDGTEFIIIALQHCGLLVLPRNIVLYKYWADLNVSTLKNGRRNIRIKEEEVKIFLYNRREQPTVDVTEYLRPCVVSR